ncbi:hypothetical protein HYX00_02185 [Candidatus Woesearchaeota archaeon]|nr:hypothetical protein [Candidatus Woesearchaeota archaeon]
MRSLTFILIFVILISYTSFAQQPQCDYKVEILVNGEEFEKEDFKWRMKATKIEGKSTNITGTAEIKANDKTVKSYKPWTSDSISKQKTSSEYSPNLKGGEYKITAEINVECEDTNKANNVDVKTIKIKDEEKEKTTEKSKKEEIDTTTDKIDDNEQIPINPNIKKASPTEPKKQTLNEETDNTIQLHAKNNQKSKSLESKTAAIVKNPETVYESSNEKAKGLIMIFLLTLSILLNIILIWKR